MLPRPIVCKVTTTLMDHSPQVGLNFACQRCVLDADHTIALSARIRTHLNLHNDEQHVAMGGTPRSHETGVVNLDSLVKHEARCLVCAAMNYSERLT